MGRIPPIGKDQGTVAVTALHAELPRSFRRVPGLFGRPAHALQVPLGGWVGVGPPPA